MKYRKKPVVIEAMQFTEDTKDRVYNWASQVHGKVYPDFDGESPVLKISTLEGVMTCSLNDWVIKGVRGELYPCKPDIFEATYEKVD